MSNLTIKLTTPQKLVAKLSSGGAGSGISIQNVLDDITVSNGLIDTRQTNKLDISGEELQTEALSNFDIKEILDL